MNSVARAQAAISVSHAHQENYCQHQSAENYAKKHAPAPREDTAK